MDRTTDFYKLWGGDELLYVGISYNAFYRFRQHMGKGWWFRADYAQVYTYRTREAAEVSEARSIRYDRPLYNIDPGKWSARQADLDPVSLEVDYVEFPLEAVL